jgi:hypothetical protein
VRVKSDICRHDRDIPVLARAQHIDPDLFALKVADRADRLVGEQLEAAGVHAHKRNNRQAGIQAGHDGSGIREAEIEFAASDTLRSKLCWDVADIGEALRAQQLFSDIRGRDADGGITAEPDRGHLRRSLVGERAPPAKNARGRGH